MTNAVVKVTIAFTDSSLDDEEKEEEVQRLITEVNDLDEVEAVERVLDPNPPAGNKAFGATLVGLLTMDVTRANAMKLFEFMSDRLGNKPIELEVEANGKKLKVKASSREELETAIQAAQEFVEA